MMMRWSKGGPPEITPSLYCAVTENNHTPPTEGIGISSGVGGFCKAKKFKEIYEA